LKKPAVPVFFSRKLRLYFYEIIYYNVAKSMILRSIISGIGHYLPPKVVTNLDLEKVINTSDEWIRQRSGIVERHYVEPGTGSSDLAYEAALKAIEDAKIDKSEIDFIIAATLSPDHYFPGIGVIVQEKLGLAGIGALDVRNQCSGFIYALSVADQYIRTKTYRKILLVAAEVHSTNLDYSDDGRDLAVLFGDGGAAFLLISFQMDASYLTYGWKSQALRTSQLLEQNSSIRKDSSPRWKAGWCLKMPQKKCPKL